ncbi:MAG TPA: ABC transporter substrate-binding protein [Acidimicrobiales bacterium]|nr:ABC transporter substrate-binding protein [Acidimicrobiales bacterium]
MSRFVKLTSVVGAASLMLLGFSGTSGAATSSKSVITIGYITSETGVASSTFADGAAGAQARVAAQNAKGGVNGHKLKLVAEDDQSSPANNQTAAQDLVQAKGAFGVIDFSSFTFAAAKYLNQQGIPVTGSEFDGPEWGMQPYTNMFTYSPATYTPFNGVYYNYLGGIAKLLKQKGVRKMAGLSYGISPSAQRSVNQLLTAMTKVGVPTCYNNSSIPFGAVDFTSSALSIKNSGCNGVHAAFVDASDIALSSSVKQAGVKAVQYYYEGYDQTVLNSPTAMTALDGDYFPSGFNFITPNSATQTMLNNLAKYDPSFHRGDIPDLGLFGSYVATDLMIYGLQHAGKNPTRQAFITNLRKVKNYTGSGLFASTPVSFTNFGTVKMLPKQACSYYVQLKGSKFVLANGGKILCAPLQGYGGS